MSLRLLFTSVLLTTAGTAAAQTDAAPASEEIRATAADAGDQPAEAAATGSEAGRSPIDGVVGHLGFGYFSGTAPLGGRYWLTRDTAIDLGVDFALSSGNLEAHRYGLEAGYVMALAHYHYAVVFGRAGLGLRFLDSFGDNSGPARWNVDGNLFLGAELFLGALGFPNISVLAGYGVQASYTYQGGSAFIIGTVNGGLNVVAAGNVGFHIYL